MEGKRSGMIALFVTWPYGTLKNGDRCLIMGFKEFVDGSTFVVTASLKTGEIAITGIKEVKIEADALRKLPL